MKEKQFKPIKIKHTSRLERKKFNKFIKDIEQKINSYMGLPVKYFK